MTFSFFFADMIRGICHWFYQRNPNDDRLHYCKFGSTCRYKHLTQEEVYKIQHHGNDKTQCPACSGSGQISVRMFNIRSDNKCLIPCVTCNGSKEITVKKIILEKSSNREWCRCENDQDRDTIYFPDGHHPKCSKHCYICSKCKGITQTG